MVLHDKGAKAQRDRAHCMQQYELLCKFMKVKRLSDKELAKLSVMQFYRLCEDTYNKQSDRKKVAFAEEMGSTPRQYPERWHWFIKDLYLYTELLKPGKRRWMRATALFRYPKYVKIKKAEAKAKREAEEKEREEAKKVLNAAMENGNKE